MINTKTILSVMTAAAILTAPIAAFATPVALGGSGTRGAHEMSRHSGMMMKRRMMMKRHMMNRNGM